MTQSVSTKIDQVFSAVSLQPDEFDLIRRLLFRKVGITLSDGKKPLVSGRLAKRLRHYRFSNFSQYYRMLKEQGFDGEEMQVFINLLTTNETYFYREHKHFDFLAEAIRTNMIPRTKMRVWSAASSTGEEAYTLALTLTDLIGSQNFEILASDINSEVLDVGRKAIYPLTEAEKIPQKILQKYCLKGTGSKSNFFTLIPQVKSRVEFSQINLNSMLPDIGMFDLIVLRNVMIYFNEDTKSTIVDRLISHLKVGGILMIGHSETLNFYKGPIKVLRPSVYQKTDRINK